MFIRIMNELVFSDLPYSFWGVQCIHYAANLSSGKKCGTSLKTQARIADALMLPHNAVSLAISVRKVT